ncbi:MAG: glucosamine-6-phosphate deaminase [Treponema sp.]|jgi:glucosamine-6-phosphate deaminase|nr:glucosamine-6-phosphate deaminase [Treponema sp.]
MTVYRKDNLLIKKYDSRGELGEDAAAEVSGAIRTLLDTKPGIRMIFAAAPSQNEFLEALARDRSVDFSRIAAFHMDEYVGLPADAPQGFGNFLRERIFEKRPFKEVHYLNGLAAEIGEECRRYTELLKKEPIDIVCLGIGENGHIAFNDPGVADFHDCKTVKVVALDLVCRQQQVNDGCFAGIDEVPTHALTLTVPVLFGCKQIFCVVPAKNKADAVYASLNNSIGENCPASILRNHGNAIMYLDAESGARLAEIRGLTHV